jgi:hypothetical protein
MLSPSELACVYGRVVAEAVGPENADFSVKAMPPLAHSVTSAALMRDAQRGAAERDARRVVRAHARAEATVRAARAAVAQAEAEARSLRHRYPTADAATLPTLLSVGWDAQRAPPTPPAPQQASTPPHAGQETHEEARMRRSHRRAQAAAAAALDAVSEVDFGAAALRRRLRDALFTQTQVCGVRTRLHLQRFCVHAH